MRPEKMLVSPETVNRTVCPPRHQHRLPFTDLETQTQGIRFHQGQDGCARRDILAHAGGPGLNGASKGRQHRSVRECFLANLEFGAALRQGSHPRPCVFGRRFVPVSATLKAASATVPAPFTDAEALAFVARQLGRAEDGEGLSLAIADAATGQARGLVWLGVRPQRGVIGIGYWVVPAARGRGLARRAVRLATAWSLDQGAARVEAWGRARQRALGARAARRRLPPRGRAPVVPGLRDAARRRRRVRPRRGRRGAAAGPLGRGEARRRLGAAARAGQLVGVRIEAAHLAPEAKREVGPDRRVAPVAVQVPRRAAAGVPHAAGELVLDVVVVGALGVGLDVQARSRPRRACAPARP